jgi:truncated hemoglobin YjbI
MLRDAHERFDIDDAAFDELLGLFRTTLQDATIAGADVETMMASLNALRPHVVHARKIM